MLVVIAYDVNTETSAGRARLRKVAKACVNFGQRVQNSVFECILDATQYRVLKHQLEQMIDPKTDRMRFYNLGDRYETRVEHVGVKEAYKPEGILIV